MNSWLQAMKQWTQWLMGDAPLPDGRSKAMLAGTVAAAAVIAVGVPAVVPSSPSANAASKLPYTSGQDTSSSQYTVPPTSSTVASSAVVAAGVPTTTTVPGASGTNPFLTQGKVRNGRHHHQAKAKAGAPATSGTAPLAAPLLAVPATTTTTPTTPLPIGAGVGYVPTPVEPVAPVAPTPLAPIDPVTNLVTPATPPPAPLATGASASVASALVTWKPPVGSPATGYDVFVGFAPGMEFPVALNGTNPVVGSSYLVTGLTAGKMYYFTVRARVSGASSAASNEVMAIPFSAYTPLGHLFGPIISMASTADGTGYWLATAAGAVSAHGSATDLGNTASLTLAAPIVKIVADPKGAGYWEVAADGGIFAYGSAHFEGAAASATLNSPIVDMVPTADGLGYWEVA
ncbi:MAG TPA: fibronectin type III domain-containing protein, partial [Acidimicrobiales bacterium]